MAWRDLFRVRRGSSGPPGVLNVLREVAVGTSESAAQTATAWAAHTRQLAEAEEERESYEAAAEWLRDHIRRHGAYFPNDLRGAQ